MIALYIVLILGAGTLLFYCFPYLSVVGDSMMPTYQDGDWGFGTRLFSRKKLTAGDVYVFLSPSSERPVVKRLAFIKDSSLWFLGDNKDFSEDSRFYGWVEPKRVKVKVLFIVKGNRNGTYKV